MQGTHVTRRMDRAKRRGFTLIELLVVVAIIAILISILLPALNGARRASRSTLCSTNMRQVGQALQTYLADNRGVFPASYYYPVTRDGGGDFENQANDSTVNGYVHFSWFLYNRGQASDNAFTCPEIPKGGHPRTFPGPDASNWEAGQRDGNGGAPGNPNAIEDKQARRMAFTGNAAIFPRNKNRAIAIDQGYSRMNRLVRDSEIKGPSDVIALTELNRNWRACAVPEFGETGLLSKAHRSINPFVSGDGSSDEYNLPVLTGDFKPFRYKTPNPAPGNAYDLRRESEIEKLTGVINGDSNIREINAVGRNHPGGDQWGGASNFLFIDGHIERMTVQKSMEDRKWGASYYSLDCVNVVAGQVCNNGVSDRYGGVQADVANP